ncbi:MAG: J domain-containing protein [Acidobacteriota bacterium]
MVNYYDILKVSQKATGPEIKSAYRRLARKLHPDRNNGSQETALKFAAIAEAYEVLGNVAERDKYDRRLVDAKYSVNGNGDSFFASANPHARRWRQMVYEKRYNDIIDRMIAEERDEALAFQKAVYPTVAMFVTAILSTAFRPVIFANSEIIGKIIIVGLFVSGVIHVIGRIRDGFDRYTESDGNIHDSILDGNERKEKPFSRVRATTLIIGGFAICLGIGYLIGGLLHLSDGSANGMFGRELSPEFLLYPPIVTLFVDLMHSIATRFERPV